MKHAVKSLLVFETLAAVFLTLASSLAFEMSWILGAGLFALGLIGAVGGIGVLQGKKWGYLALQLPWIGFFLLIASLTSFVLKDLFEGSTSWSSGGLSFAAAGLLGSGLVVFLNFRTRNSFFPRGDRY
jgi:hypothetical protein